MQKLVPGWRRKRERRRRRRRRPGLWRENVCRWCGSSVRAAPSPTMWTLFLISLPKSTFLRAEFTNTHLALHFHGGTVGSPQRLRLFKAPIHFAFSHLVLSVVEVLNEKRKEKGKKKVQAPLPADRGALVPGLFWCKKFFFKNPPASSPMEEDVRPFLYFISPPGCFSSSSVRSGRRERGAHRRRGGEQLAALTRDCELSFEMTSALLKKKKKKMGSCEAFMTARNLQVESYQEFIKNLTIISVTQEPKSRT